MLTKKKSMVVFLMCDSILFDNEINQEQLSINPQ